MSRERVVDVDGEPVRLTIERTDRRGSGIILPEVRFALIARKGPERRQRSAVLVDDPAQHDLDAWPETELVRLAREKLM